MYHLWNVRECSSWSGYNSWLYPLSIVSQRPRKPESARSSNINVIDEELFHRMTVELTTRQVTPFWSLIIEYVVDM